MGAKFSFPDDKPVFRPDRQVSQFKLVNTCIAFLAVTFVAGTIAMVVLVAVMLHRADAIPYVADGGEFGCRVPVLSAGK